MAIHKLSVDATLPVGVLLEHMRSSPQLSQRHRQVQLNRFMGVEDTGPGESNPFRRKRRGAEAVGGAHEWKSG